jgi:hypothetical protein
VSVKPLPLPPAAERHYRAFAFVVHEQRLMALLLAGVAAATGLIWLTAASLKDKPAVVVRAPRSLREAAEQFASGTDISYDQLAFFLNGCVPLLYFVSDGRHPWLSLAEGLVSPDLCRDAEHRLDAHSHDVAAQGLSQALEMSDIDGVVSDKASGRVAAHLQGVLRVSSADAPTREYPWAARAILTANPRGRLNPYPFYLLSLEPETTP